MTDTYDTKEPFGVGRLIGRTFSEFFRNILLFLGIAFVPTLVISMLSYFAMTDVMEASLTGAVVDPSQIFGPMFFLTTVLSLVAYLLIIGVTTIAAYDRINGEALDFGQYIGRTMGSILPILILGLIYYILFVLGLVLLIVPGLYVGAMFLVLIPVILIERAGFRGLSRAAELSKGYRWALVGAIVLLFLVLIVLSLGLQFVSGAIFLAVENIWLVLILQAIVSSVTYGFSAVFTALAYARLKELKEGLGMSDLVKVFS